MGLNGGLLNNSLSNIIELREQTLTYGIIGANLDGSKEATPTNIGGYSPLCIVGFRISGYYSTLCNLNRCEIYNGEIKTSIHNNTSNVLNNITVTVQVLYVKSILIAS